MYAFTSTNSYLTGQGSIRSPNYPNIYPNNQHILYEIKQPVGIKIDITFHTFEIEYQDECNWDYLQVNMEFNFNSFFIYLACVI